MLPFATGSGRPPARIARSARRAGRSPRAYAHYFPDTRDRRRRHRPGAVRDRAQVLRAGGAAAAARVRRGRAAFLRSTDERYDSIFVDAYRQPYIPFYLTTREFFSLVRDRLKPGGSVIINVGHPRDSEELEKALRATLGKVFAHVPRDPIQNLTRS